MQVWITKYALTIGIMERDVDPPEDGTIAVRDPGVFTKYYHHGEWFETPSEARDRAEEMRNRKIASVKKQLAKLEAMKF